MARKIRDLMTPDPKTLDARSTVKEAAAAMRDHDIGDVLVTEDGIFCGILTDRDIVVRAISEGRDPATTSVGEICSTDVVTISLDEDPDQAVDLMRGQAVRRLPVCEDGEVHGVVSIGDLAVEKDPRSALAGISAAEPND